MPLISSSPFRLAQAAKNAVHPLNTQPIAHSTRQSVGRLRTPLQKDTLQFGDDAAKTTQKSFWNRIGSRLNAGARGAWGGFFTLKNWKWDAAYVTIGTLGTLPLAAAIPGSHFLLVPALYVGSRVINSLFRAGKGLIKPEWVLGK